MGACYPSGRRRTPRRKIPGHIVHAVHKATRGHCYYCKRSVGPATRRRDRWTVDHFRARVTGGPDHIGNYVCCCARCNGRKYRKDPFRFAMEGGYLPLRCRHIGTDGLMCLQPGLSSTRETCFSHSTLSELASAPFL